MRLKFLAFLPIGAALWVSSSALSQDSSCREIADAAKRLECFDRSAAEPAKKSPSAKPAPGRYGWVLNKSKDRMTDKISCVVSPPGKPFIQVNLGSLYISYRSRGGLQGFQYRIDDAPISRMQLPTPIEQQISAAHIRGATFDQILRSRRLRVQALTLVAGVITDDVDLSGLSAVYARMQRECQI